MPDTSASPAPAALDQGTYEILQARLASRGAELRARMEKLNAARQEVFGSIKAGLVATERVTTRNNCTPRDITALGESHFLFGFNVHIGLRTETQLSDVFAIYEHKSHQFRELQLDALKHPQFEEDFKGLYRYYKNTVFTKFALQGPFLFMEFRVGKSVADIKTFKWLREGGQLTYLGNRFDHEYRFPSQHEFDWTRTHRELHRSGLHPHISISDRLFVECVNGDLTVKVEDNTDSGEGIYSEAVEHRDQTLDDAEIFFAVVGNLILLKVRPYQEKRFRYLVFNEKLKEVRRIDAIEDSCVLLPDGHGIIFSRGYYLQSGEFKEFETSLSEMVFDKRIASPNGEDILFTFYNRDGGDYILMSYNVIARTVETPILCSGFSLFENGEMALFRSEVEPQKHHTIQVWQTPYVGITWQPEVKPTSHLYKIGNPDLVRALAECTEVLTLLGKDDSFTSLYVDLFKRGGDILDSYFWIGHPEAFDLRSPLVDIREAASSALAEFEKVAGIKKRTATEVQRVTGTAAKLVSGVRGAQYDEVNAFIQKLADLRASRGELIALKELRYVDLAQVEERERDVIDTAEQLSKSTVAFLLQPEALSPIVKRVDILRAAVEPLAKVTEAEALDHEISRAAAELDLLTETVSGLSIQDATETTRIIENISRVYAVLNQARSTLRNRVKVLRGSEAVAEFASQVRLLDQALTNYLDLCTTPHKCDEYLNRIMLQIEELEARFADFDDFVIQLSERRTAISSAFEARKLELIEDRNRKTGALLTAAERILKGIQHRAERCSTAEEIHSYFAADAMTEKVRSQIQQLIDLGDSVKADDLQGKLKTVREDAIRQLKDKQELFAGGADTIRLGRHQFLVNTQELDLTIVPRGDSMAMHLTGTAFFETIRDEAFLATRSVWAMNVVSETPEIYRAEYLAYVSFGHMRKQGGLEAAARLSPGERLVKVQEYMSTRYAEGYSKGVHDLDAAAILGALLDLHTQLGLLRYSPQARTCAALFWHQLAASDRKSLLAAKLRGYAEMKRLFPSPVTRESYLRELHELLHEWVTRTGLFEARWLTEASEYLYFQLKRSATDDPSAFVVAPEATELRRTFEQHITAHHFRDPFVAALNAVNSDLSSKYDLLRDWVRGFLGAHPAAQQTDYADETAWLLLIGGPAHPAASHGSAVREVTGLVGSHPRLQDGKLPVHYIHFMRRLGGHEAEVVPVWERFQSLKRDAIEQARARLRITEFKPRVLTSFVRNQLIDSVYLPLVGDNLAKQIGAAGDAKRTDRMGLLLLVSPPGYGKTTLLEYLASRLGIVFMKVNGPAIGHRVTSLDPAESPNAAARDELQKLNLAFEMGDNVMICLDDIQHLNPEFLQKFISLCDGQRRIEGVYRGEPRTYDLRGRKIVVVMAGNPYTETGDRFQLPDMLANRADTYNLGDIIGGHGDAFKASYIENSATSNRSLARIAGRSVRDIATALRLAETGSADGLDFEGTYSPEELAEVVSVLKKLIRIREVILRVNAEYIRSAAQADAYRTEPPFKLQGSYRNMNRMAEKVSPVMNDTEIEDLIQDHYKNDAQTLTSGTESNLLKLKELTGSLDPEQMVRWEEIKKTFRKNQLLRGGDERDPVTQVVRQLSACFDGIEGIKEALASGLAAQAGHPVTLIIAPPAEPLDSAPEFPTLEGDGSSVREVKISRDALKKIWEVIEQQKVAGNGNQGPTSNPACS